MAFDFDYFLLDEITAVGDKLFARQPKALSTKREQSNAYGLSPDARPVNFATVVFFSMMEKSHSTQNR